MISTILILLVNDISIVLLFLKVLDVLKPIIHNNNEFGNKTLEMLKLIRLNQSNQNSLTGSNGNNITNNNGCKIYNDGAEQQKSSNKEADEINKNRQENSNNSEINLQKICENYPVLTELLIMYNGNVTMSCEKIINEQYQKNILDTFERLKESTKKYNGEKGKTYEDFDRYFYLAWKKIYQYCLLNYYIDKKNEQINKLKEELLGINNLDFNLPKMNFNDSDYIVLHVDFVENNILSQITLNSKRLILDWCDSTKSIIPYYPDIYLFNTRVNKNVFDIFATYDLYSKLCEEIIKIYLSRSIEKSPIMISEYRLQIDNLFTAIKQCYMTENINKSGLLKSVNRRYDQAQVLQNVLDELGLKYNDSMLHTNPVN